MKKILAILILCFVTSTIFANSEDDVAPVSLYGTVGGYGLLYSIGGQYLITKGFGINVGYSNFEIKTNEDSILFEDKLEITSIPLFSSFYFGKANHRFFMEAGISIFRIKGHSKDFIIEGIHDAVLPVAGFGYNYHNMEGGLFFKIGANIIIFEDDILPWFGISLGVTF